MKNTWIWVVIVLVIVVLLGWWWYGKSTVAPVSSTPTAANTVTPTGAIASRDASDPSLAQDEGDINVQMSALSAETAAAAASASQAQ